MPKHSKRSTNAKKIKTLVSNQGELKQKDNFIDKKITVQYHPSDWKYQILRSEILKYSHTISKGHWYVNSNFQYPHFHVGKNWICLSTGEKKHNYLIHQRYVRKPSQFFSNLGDIQDQVILNIVNQLRKAFMPSNKKKILP